MLQKNTKVPSLNPIFLPCAGDLNRHIQRRGNAQATLLGRIVKYIIFIICTKHNFVASIFRPDYNLQVCSHHSLRAGERTHLPHKSNDKQFTNSGFKAILCWRKEKHATARRNMQNGKGAWHKFGNARGIVVGLPDAVVMYVVCVNVYLNIYIYVRVCSIYL